MQYCETRKRILVETPFTKPPGFAKYISRAVVSGGAHHLTLYVLPGFSYLATVRIPNNKCAEPMERIRTWELIPTNQNLLYQKTWYNYFPSKIVGLLKAQVWDSIRFQCLWLDRDVKINYWIFMSYIILLHATLQLWQPRKCMTMNFSESYFKKKLPTTLRLGSKPKINNLGYHKNQGSCGILWTPLFFYDWMKSGWQSVNFAE